MKSTATFVAVLVCAGTTLAQDCKSLTSAIPACLSACAISAASAVGCTNPDDLACQCNPASSAAIAQTAQPCALSACNNNIPLLLSGLNAAQAICSCVATATSAAPVVATTTSNAAVVVTTSTSTSSSAPGPITSSPMETKSSVVVSSDAPSLASTTCVAVTMAGSAGNDCSPLAAKLEPCAQGCFSSAIPEVGCDVTDFACQCNPAKQAVLSTKLIPCVQSACNVAVLPSLIAEAQAVCDCANGSGGGAAPAVTTTTCYAVGGQPTLTTAGSNPTIGSNYTSKPPTVTAGATRFELGVVGSIFAGAFLAAIAL